MGCLLVLGGEASYRKKPSAKKGGAKAPHSKGPHTIPVDGADGARGRPRADDDPRPPPAEDDWRALRARRPAPLPSAAAEAACATGGSCRSPARWPPPAPPLRLRSGRDPSPVRRGCAP